MSVALPLSRAVVAAAVAAGLWAAPGGSPAFARARPATVPAVRSWSPARRAFRLRADARIVVASTQRRRLLGEARLLAADLAGALHLRVGVVAAGGVRPRPGDVSLRLASSSPRLRREGYELVVGRSVRIVASTTAGVFYGGRTLIQVLRAPGPTPRGTARDAPRYPERGLMIDIARKPFSLAWLEREVRAMSDLKLNLLHLHFSDNEGFRIASTSHPEVVTRPALSKRAVRTLVVFAARRHVAIVPEIDMPGHMAAALRAHPQLALVDSSGRRAPDKLDVSLPAARAFAADLVREYLPLFPGAWWHSGSDEYLGVASTPAGFQRYPQLQAYARARHGPTATGQDAVLDFTNSIGRLVRAAGRQQRVWSDGESGGAAVRLDRRAVVEWWENRASRSPAALAADGHRVLNVGWWPLYYVTGGPAQSLRARLDQMYTEWEPWRFEGPYTARWATGLAAPAAQLLAPDDPHLLGASLAIWNDHPNAASPAAIAAGVLPRLRVVAQKAWGSALLTADPAAFETIAGRVAPTP